MLAGQVGRENRIGAKLVEEGCELYVVGQHLNPGLVENTKTSGGQFFPVDDLRNVNFIAERAVESDIDMLWVNAEACLASGVVDAVRARMPSILFPCPDKEGSRVEWDKFDLRQLVEEINPDYNPLNFMVETKEAAIDAIRYFKRHGIAVAIKPRNLAGGRGVQVMGKHFETYEEATAYALQQLASKTQTGVEIQEKLEGPEFTIQAFTDGKILIKPPATYDYPYRDDGDKGSGTGGMGSFTMQDGLLPFLSEAEYDEAMELMRQILVKLDERGRNYKGILYGTFFKTKQGIKIVEINARGGDPELINIIDLLEDDMQLHKVLELIALGELKPDSVRYKKLASAMIYLVSPDYVRPCEPKQYEFEINPEIIAANGCRLNFASAEQIGPNRYRTVKVSRTVGMSATDKTPWAARRKIHRAIRRGISGPLEYRKDIGRKGYISKLSRAA